MFEGIDVESTALLRIGVLGMLSFVAYFDSLMHNHNTHENDEILGHLIVPVRYLATIENEGQANINGAYSLDGQFCYAPFVMRTRDQLRVLVIELDRIIPYFRESSTKEIYQLADVKRPWLVVDPNDPYPQQDWYTAARYFARQLVKDDSTLLTKKVLLARKTSTSLENAGIYKRGARNPFSATTILKSFSNVTLG